MRTFTHLSGIGWVHQEHTNKNSIDDTSSVQFSNV